MCIVTFPPEDGKPQPKPSRPLLGLFFMCPGKVLSLANRPHCSPAPTR